MLIDPISLPTSPGRPRIFTPGTEPCKALVKEVTGRFEIAFVLTVFTAPERFTFFCLP